MEKAGNSRARAGLGHQWTSFQKVEEMLSKAIRQQQDLRNMLLLIHAAPEIYHETHTLSPHVVSALKVKLENAMDWCHLALCRLKEIISRSTSRGNIDVIPGVQWSQGSGFFSFNDTAAQTCDGAEHSQGVIAPADDDAQEHKLILRSLPSNLELDWDMLTEDQAQLLLSELQADSGAPIETPIQSPSSSCHLPHRSTRLVTSLSSPRPRSCGPKRDREEASGSDEKDTIVSVVFQELKPGDDTKKGIPDDGHRGWKKYGNKTIQNSNFCRGYYKCSMKECGAKKMVQPTDQNPAIFEVTYVGTHTCSSTSRNRRHRPSTSTATPIALARNPPQQAPPDILVQTKIARLLIKNQPTTTSSIQKEEEELRSPKEAVSVHSIGQRLSSTELLPPLEGSRLSSISSNPSSNVSCASHELDYLGTELAYELDVVPRLGQLSERDEVSTRIEVNAEIGEGCSPESVCEGDVGLMRLRDDEDGEMLGFHSLLWQESWSVDT